MSNQAIKKSQIIQIEIDSDLSKIIKQAKALYKIGDNKEIIKLLILQGLQKNSAKKNKQNFITYLNKIKAQSKIYSTIPQNLDYQSIYEDHLDKKYGL
jgi:hypothetical protein